jgi:MFS family permease
MIWVAALLEFSISRAFLVSVAALLVAGFCQVSFVAAANNRIQTLTPDHLRGRVMGLYAQALIGVTPFGSTQAGALATLLGAPWAMAIGAIVAGAVVIVIWLARPQVFARALLDGGGEEPTPIPRAISRSSDSPQAGQLGSAPPR